ncbi:MAG: TetR/AcrR family transcriptional regulator [Proteobacteria bacterium]|nr:TetR/AcrR family transcriptional regulator [Pseudomonadota bacterium]
MSAKLTDTEKRSKIMEATSALILHYGYKKTTMQDIAEKAEISVGSIYNFFKNKDDIIIECAKNYKDNVLKRLRDLCDGSLKPEDKIREMMLLARLACQDYFKDTPHGMEIVMALEHRGEEINEKFNAAELSIIAEVIEQGVRKGDFSVKDPMDTARTFISAFAGFCPPMSMAFSKEESERALIKMVDMLLPAIRRVR